MNTSLVLLALAVAANLYAGLSLAGATRVRCVSVALLGSALALFLADPITGRWAMLDAQLLRALCGG